MKYQIIRVYNTTETITPSGALAFGQPNHSAIAMSDESVIARLDRATLVMINPDGIMLSGFEADGINRDGTSKYKYSEWFCRYLP